MEIRRYLSILRRRALLVFWIIVAAIAAGYIVAPRTGAYTATSTLYVGSRSIDINPTSGEVSGDRVAGLDRLIATFTAMAGTRPIVQTALDHTRLSRSVDDVVANTHAAQVPSTDLIRITVRDQSAFVSAALANAVAGSLVDQIRAFEPRDTPAAAQRVLSVYETATVPSSPDPTGLARNLALAAVFGILVAALVVALLEHLDISVRSTSEAEHQLDLPVLGVVPAGGQRLAFATGRAARRAQPRGARNGVDDG